MECAYVGLRRDDIKGDMLEAHGQKCTARDLRLGQTLLKSAYVQVNTKDSFVYV